MPGTYIREMSRTQMRRYAEQWEGLPLPRLQLRWSPKPVPKRERRAEIEQSKRICARMNLPYHEDQAWDCFYELLLPSKNHTRDELYNVGFIIVPISWTRRTSDPKHPPCSQSPTDDVWRDGMHAFWDSSVLGWPPIYVIAPNGTATQRTGYDREPEAWKAKASAVESDDDTPF